MPNKRKLHVYSPSTKIDNLLFNMSYFDQQTDMEEHQHSCIEIAVYVHGTGEHVSGNYIHPLHRGIVCITLPGGSHGMRNCNHLQHYNIACSTELLQNIGCNLVFLRGVRIIFGGKDKAVLLQMTEEEMKDVENLVSRMYDIYEENARFEGGDMKFQFALLLCLFAQAYERGCMLGENQSERIANAATYIQKHLQHNLTISKLARQLSVSPSQLIRVFQKKYGITPIEYLLRQRLELAQELLQTTHLPIKEIAFRCGFANGSYFSNFVKKRTSLSPEEIRSHSEENKT